MRNRKEPLVRKKKRDTVRGCPSVEIDWDKFESLCKVMATEDEICHLFNVVKETLNSHIRKKYNCKFSEIRNSLCDITKVSLRRAQIRKAIEDKNVVMQIWLGKQYLGQTDKVVEATGDINDQEFMDKFFGLK